MGRPLDEDCFADGLGGSFTIREGGGMDIGLDFLGNQFANASFDSESGEWGNPQFNSSWASDVTQMMQQDFADNEQKSRTQKEKTAAALAGLSVDSSEKYRREFDAAERRLGENFDSDKFNGEFFSSNPAVDEARKNRYLEMLRSKDPNAVSNFTKLRKGIQGGTE